MDFIKQDVKDLFIRDLDKLIENVKAVPEDQLWEAPEGVTNSCGVLAQHLVGNINHYIGYALGNTGYLRERDSEFIDTRATKNDLIRRVEKLQTTLKTVFQSLESETLTEDYPLDISYDASTQKFLIHLYGHLNYHLGQLNYLYRMLAES